MQLLSIFVYLKASPFRYSVIREIIVLNHLMNFQYIEWGKTMKKSYFLNGLRHWPAGNSLHLAWINFNALFEANKI